PRDGGFRAAQREARRRRAARRNYYWRHLRRGFLEGDGHHDVSVTGAQREAAPDHPRDEAWNARHLASVRHGRLGAGPALRDRGSRRLHVGRPRHGRRAVGSQGRVGVVLGNAQPRATLSAPRRYDHTGRQDAAVARRLDRRGQARIQFHRCRQAVVGEDERRRIRHVGNALRSAQDGAHRDQALTRSRTSVAAPSLVVSDAPRPLLRLADAIGITVGIVIGAGIYKTPPMVAGVTGDVGWLIVAWALGAVVSLAGALCYAELATAYPHAGGDYSFLTRAFGRHTSFLYAWARSTVINSGAIALLAFVFGDYMSTVLSLGPASGALWATVIVIALTFLNIAGLRASAGAQNLLLVIEVGGLLAVAVAGFMAPAVDTMAPAAFTTTPALGMFGLAMVFVLLTY